VVSWTAEEYVSRVIIETAREFGRPVREVLAEPFALTLWSWGQCQAMGREARVTRMGERTDMAGLIAVAFHEPAKLQAAETRYLKAAGLLKPMQQAQKARLDTLREQYEAAMAKATTPEETAEWK
jgi:hypothetical protein